MLTNSLFAQEAQISPDIIKLGRKILNSWSDPEQLMWFREQTLNPVAKLENGDGKFLRTVLIGNAIELATKKNDLWAYNYLVQRLVLSKFKEEKSDVVEKLTIWPGAVDFRYTSFPVLIRAAEGEPKGTLRYMILMGISHLIKVDPSLSVHYKSDFEQLTKYLCGDKQGFNIITQKD
jgi:hypothetical protein